MSLCNWRVSLIMTEDINTHRVKSIFGSRMSAALRMTRASHMKKIIMWVVKRNLGLLKRALFVRRGIWLLLRTLELSNNFLRHILKEMVVLCSLKCKQTRRCTYDVTFLVSWLLLFISKTINIYSTVRSTQYISQQFFHKYFSPW